MAQYDALAQRALALITKKGGPVVFPGTGTPPVYNEATDTYAGGTAGVNTTGRAVQVNGDPDRFAAMHLTLINPVTLIVAAVGLAITPIVGMVFIWGGVRYTIKDADTLKPDGVTAIIHTITGTT